jgi:hypothetical protein
MNRQNANHQKTRNTRDQTTPALGYRPPKTRWYALLDLSIGLAFWGAMFVLFARYIGVMR